MVLEGELHLARPADDRANGTPIPDQDVSQCGVASPVLLPTPHVRDGQPLHEPHQVPVMLWPKEQVPVIGHHAVATNAHQRFVERLGQNALERLVIPRLLEELHGRNTPIEHMKDHSSRHSPCGPWHGRSLTHLAYLVNVGPVPFSSFTSCVPVSTPVPGIRPGIRTLTAICPRALFRRASA